MSQVTEKLHLSISYLWPALVGIGTGVVPISVILFAKGLWYISALLVPLFLIFLGLSLYSEVKRHGKRIIQEEERLLEEGWSATRIATLIIIGSEAFIFGVAFAIYFLFRGISPQWPDPGTPHLDLEFPLINTIVLLSSGVTAHFAHMSIKRGNLLGLKSLLIVTIILGTFFIFGQVYEYGILGVPIYTSKFITSFYLLTGIHGAHVVAGLIFLSVVFIRSLMGHFTKYKNDVVESSVYYWHFVDAVWVILFSLLYLQIL
ncbi:Cytochrome c oxidase subunit 3 [archaeon HR06]|nr:Cytochrome c oxidase subunit 3 [archaeon HR06]